MKPKEGMVLVLETSLVEKYNNLCIIDSVATNNVCTYLQGLQVQRKLREGEFTLRVGTENLVLALVVRVIKLYFGNKIFLLRDFFYVPELNRNLVSISSLIKHSYSVIFNESVSVYKNNVLICYGTKENNLYKITPNVNSLLNTEFISDELILKRVKLDVNKTYIWHLRLCHIN